ncbi:hypothetical protein KF728_09555 [Candidatus Obscuribacterales bacterium]|nr:hypothetical protein [Candidatus Obscuribacterales bacterium]
MKMQSPRISLRVSAKVYDEIERLAVNEKHSVSDMTRELLHEALARRAEGMTKSQFAYVEERLEKIQEHFASLMVRAVFGVGQCLYFVDQNFLIEATPEQKKHFREKSETYADDFLRRRKLRVKPVEIENQEDSES